MEQPEKHITGHDHMIWYLPSKGRTHYHRLDGHAIEYADGTKYWYVDGKRHRVDGPAIEKADGTKAWFIDGKLNRLDGPAIEYADGTKVWYVDGKKLLTGEVEDWLEENNVDLQTTEGLMSFKLKWM